MFGPRAARVLSGSTRWALPKAALPGASGGTAIEDRLAALDGGGCAGCRRCGRTDDRSFVHRPRAGLRHHYAANRCGRSCRSFRLGRFGFCGRRCFHRLFRNRGRLFLSSRGSRRFHLRGWLCRFHNSRRRCSFSNRRGRGRHWLRRRRRSRSRLGRRGSGFRRAGRRRNRWPHHHRCRRRCCYGRPRCGSRSGRWLGHHRGRRWTRCNGSLPWRN